MTDTFYADVSEFQTYLTTAYPSQVFAFRVDSGYRIDRHAYANWHAAQAMLATGQLRVVIAYSVYIPGEESAQYDRVTAFFGSNRPTNRLVLMLDMESGRGFAGPGDHSAGANALASRFAGYLGAWARVWPYANGNDYHGNWRGITANLIPHEIHAAYSTHDPGSYAWQYDGQTGDPTPAGYPTSMAPFGRCDMNVIHRSIAQIETDLGITTPAPPDLLEQIMALDRNSSDYKNLIADISTSIIERLFVDQNGDPHFLNSYFSRIGASGFTPYPTKTAGKKK